MASHSLGRLDWNSGLFHALSRATGILAFAWRSTMSRLVAHWMKYQAVSLFLDWAETEMAQEMSGVWLPARPRGIRAYPNSPPPLDFVGFWKLDPQLLESDAIATRPWDMRSTTS